MLAHILKCHVKPPIFGCPAGAVLPMAFRPDATASRGSTPPRGESLCGIQVHMSDINLATFPNRGWPAIEHWAERAPLKPDVWRAQRTTLSLKIKIEIPVSGASIQIQQHALKLDQIPDSWPCNLESGWTAKYGLSRLPWTQWQTSPLDSPADLAQREVNFGSRRFLSIMGNHGGHFNWYKCMNVVQFKLDWALGPLT